MFTESHVHDSAQAQSGSTHMKAVGCFAVEIILFVILAEVIDLKSYAFGCKHFYSFLLLHIFSKSGAARCARKVR